jgi:hypothetical protein
MTIVRLRDGSTVDVDVPDYVAVAHLIEARRAGQQFIKFAADAPALQTDDVAEVVPDFVGRRQQRGTPA